MGIYDREYYRREGPSFLGSFANRGQACKTLIIINVVMFVLQMVVRVPHTHVEQMLNKDGEEIDVPYKTFTYPLQDALILDTNKVLHGEVWRVITHAFLHSGVMHILFNMLFLWWFGSDVEDLYGTREFTAIYLVAALMGGLAFVACDVAMEPVDKRLPGLGASGAVTAVMVLCAIHYPTRTILLFFFLPVPIWLFVIFQVGQDLLGLLLGLPGVAWSAHLGGAGFAFLYYKLHLRILNFMPTLRKLKPQRARPRLKVYREEEGPAPPVAVAAPTASADVDEQLEAKLDAVLEKVARFGQSSLTETEREILFRASEVYKKRRK